MTITINWSIQGVDPPVSPVTVTISSDACSCLESYRQSITTQQKQTDPDTQVVTYTAVPLYPDILSMLMDKVRTGFLQSVFQAFPPPQVQTALTAVAQAQQAVTDFTNNAITTGS